MCARYLCHYAVATTHPRDTDTATDTDTAAPLVHMLEHCLSPSVCLFASGDPRRDL